MAKITNQFQASVTELEIACGFDGLLRGKPEPVVIVAAYMLDGQTTRTLGRALYRFAPETPFPSSCFPVMPTHIGVQVQHSAPISFAVVACALEEDGGEDVQSVYGALEHHRQLEVWPTADSSPTPLHVAELYDTPAEWRYPRRVNLMVEGRDIATACRSDKWVGCAAWAFQGSPQQKAEFRAPFQSPCKRNDWVALVRIYQ